MKKLLGILTLAIVMSGPAWAWDNFSVTIGNQEASIWYKSRSGDWDADSEKYYTSRHRGRERATDKRIARIDRQLERQAVRIQDARESGELTRKEFRRLRAGHRQIQNYRHTSLGDGRLSQREWRNLTTMLDRAGERIDRLRNNRRNRDNNWPHFRPYARNW